MNIEGQYMNGSHIPAGNVTSKLLPKEILLNTKGQYIKDSNGRAQWCMRESKNEDDLVCTSRLSNCVAAVHSYSYIFVRTVRKNIDRREFKKTACLTQTGSTILLQPLSKYNGMMKLRTICFFRII